MSSDKQKAANRENARKSTGPTTPEGKAKASRNRYTHGFFSSVTFAPGENREDYVAHCHEYQDTFQPANAAERALVEQLINNKWLEMRAMRLQGQALMHYAIEKAEFGIPKELGLLIRYLTTAQRGFNNALVLLVKLQKERASGEFGFDPQNLFRNVNITWINREEDLKKPAPTPENPPEPAPKPDEAPPKAA